MNKIKNLSIETFKLDLEQLEPELRQQVVELANSLELHPPILTLSPKDMNEIVEHTLKNEN